VLGAGLENPEHPDHWLTQRIVQATTARVFGYIDLGVVTSGLPLRQIRRSMRRWKKMGAVGVLLDDYGYDWGVTRRRQNRAVRSAHWLGLGDFLLMESWPFCDGQEDPAWGERAARFDALCGILRIMSVSTGPFDPDLMRIACGRAEQWGHKAFGWGEPDYGADGNAPWRPRPDA
jgi:hypothetical protein